MIRPKEKQAEPHNKTRKELRQAGQGFFLARYPFHYHMTGSVSKSYVHNCSIHHTYNRAVAIHGVHDLQLCDNVAYNIRGHAYFIEDGIETKNILTGNLGILVRPVWSLLHVDMTPTVFWITNPDNVFISNVAAGGSHDGFWIRPLAHPDGPSFTRAICILILGMRSTAPAWPWGS